MSTGQIMAISVDLRQTGLTNYILSLVLVGGKGIGQGWLHVTEHLKGGASGSLLCSPCSEG